MNVETHPVLKLQAGRSVRAAVPRARVAAPVGIAWLNGILVVSAETGEGPKHWMAPGRVGNPEEAGEALRQASDALGLPGGRAALVFAGPQIMPIGVEVPAAPEPVIRRLLSREADRQKSFPGPAVWQEESTDHARAGGRRFLHVLSREIHDRLVVAFRQSGFHLTHLIPVVEASRTVVPRGTLPSDESLLVAALIPEGLSMWVGRPNETLLIREVPALQASPERLAAEIRRTLSFARQQSSVPLDRVWLAGPEPEIRLLQDLLSAAGLNLGRTDTSSPGFWAEWARKSGAQAKVNLLSEEPGRSPHHRAVSRWSAVLGGLVLLLSVGLAFTLEQGRRQAIADRQLLEVKQQGREAGLVTARSVAARILKERKWVDRWDAEANSPLHLWAPAVLAEALGTSVLLSELDLEAQIPGWKLRLTGQRSGPESGKAADTWADLSRKLQNGPLHLSGVRDPRGAAQADPIGSWTQLLQARNPPLTEPAPGLQLEGVIR